MLAHLDTKKTGRHAAVLLEGSTEMRRIDKTTHGGDFLERKFRFGEQIRRPLQARLTKEASRRHAMMSLKEIREVGGAKRVIGGNLRDAEWILQIMPKIVRSRFHDMSLARVEIGVDRSGTARTLRASLEKKEQALQGEIDPSSGAGIRALVFARDNVKVPGDFGCVVSELNHTTAPLGWSPSKIEADPGNPRLFGRPDLLAMRHARLEEKRLAGIEHDATPRTKSPRALTAQDEGQFIKRVLMPPKIPGAEMGTQRDHAEGRGRLPELHVSHIKSGLIAIKLKLIQ